MNELLEFAVKAHGGLGRWNQLKNQNHVVFKDFAGKGNESVFRPDKLFIKNEKGETLWTRIRVTPTMHKSLG